MLDAIRVGAFYVVLSIGAALLLVFTAAAWYWAINKVYRTIGMTKEFFLFLILRRRGRTDVLHASASLMDSNRALLQWDETPEFNKSKRDDLLRVALTAARRADRQMKEK